MKPTVRQRRTLPGLFIAGLFVCFCLIEPAFGISLEDYKKKVDDARVLAVGAEVLVQSGELNDTQSRELIRHIRETFPASETVTWDGGDVETSNEWLLASIAQFEKQTDAEKRGTIALQIREHLSTVVYKLQELDAAARSGRSKDEDKQKLAEILRREEYQKPQPKGESAFSKWLTWILEWFEKLFDSGERTTTAPRLEGLGSVFRIVIYLGLFLIVGFLAYKLIPLIARSSGSPKKTKKKDRIILGEKIADDETAIDLLAEAERLASEGNLRGAIRKGYIALLCELSDRKVLGLARHKTNRDYLRDVRSRTDLHPPMKVVTDTFEKHWYGEQQSAVNDWVQFRDDYERTLRNI